LGFKALSSIGVVAGASGIVKERPSILVPVAWSKNQETGIRRRTART